MCGVITGQPCWQRKRGARAEGHGSGGIHPHRSINGQIDGRIQFNGAGGTHRNVIASFNNGTGRNQDVTRRRLQRKRMVCTLGLGHLNGQSGITLNRHVARTGNHAAQLQQVAAIGKVGLIDQVNVACR